MLLKDQTQTEIKELMQAVGIIATEITDSRNKLKPGRRNRIPRPPATRSHRRAGQSEFRWPVEKWRREQNRRLVQPIEIPQDEPGTVILGKTEKSNVNVPPAVQKAAEEVKEKLPRVIFNTRSQ